MGNDVSNKTIVALLAVALVVTVVGTVMSVSKLSELGGQGGGYLTGAIPSQTGQSNLSITSVTSITLAGGNNTEIQWGGVYVNSSCDLCMLDTVRGLGGSIASGGDEKFNETCCVQASGSNYSSGGWLLENTGNTNISVNISCSGDCNPSEFVGVGSNVNYTYWVIDEANDPATGTPAGVSDIDTRVSCAGRTHGGGGETSWYGWKIRENSTMKNNRSEAVAVTVTGSGHWLCGNRTHFPLNYSRATNAGVLHFNVTIDAETRAGAGQKNATFTINAVS